MYMYVYIYLYICIYMCTIPTATELHQCLPGVQYYMYCIHTSVSMHVSTNMCKYVCVSIYIQRTRCYRTSLMPTWCAILHAHVHVCIHICAYMYMCTYKFIKPTATETCKYVCLYSTHPLLQKLDNDCLVCDSVT